MSLGETFVRLCEIPSPSGSEAGVAAYVRAALSEAGLDVTEDSSGNLLTRISGPPGTRAVMLCSHMDTVPLAGGVEVVLVDGVYRNSLPAILGGDDKVGVAAMLEAARRWATGGAPCTCELVFTTGEEAGLLGAIAFDAAALEARIGFVLDHAAPVGQIVVAGPSYYSIEAEFIGRAAHAGIRPEDGHSAIAAAAKAIEAVRLGRLDEETTANVGVIKGGVSPTIVPERCLIEAEVRSLDDGKASEVAREMIDAITRAASAAETDVNTTIAQHLRAYRIPESDPAVAIASAAVRDCGLEPAAIASGGGSDASAFIEKGITCVNLAVGVEGNHTADERVSAYALEKVLDVTLRLPERAVG